MKLQLVLASVFLFVSMGVVQAQAEDAKTWSGKIIQVQRDSKKAVAEVPKGTSVAVDTAVTAVSKSGESCEGKVVRQTGRKLSLSFGDCASFADIKAGSVVEPSLYDSDSDAANEAPTPVPANGKFGRVKVYPGPVPEGEVEPVHREPMIPRSRRVRFALGLFYDSGNQFKFDSVTTTSSGSGSVTYKSEAASGLRLEGLLSDPEAWGFQVGMTLESKRNLKSADINLTGVSTALDTSGSPAITLFHIYGNLLYRFDRVYIPFGLNISAPSVENTTGALDGLNGGVGGQVGVGYVVAEHLNAELLARVSTVNGKDNGTVNIGRGSMGSGEVALNYVF